MSIRALRDQSVIIGTLMLREIITRYGRRGLGFLWLVAEPLIFTFGVLFIWSIIRPPYSHGVALAPFVLTGYMGLLFFRHLITYSMGAITGNAGLLYHQTIKLLHLYSARYVLEFLGSTFAFAIGYAILVWFGQMELPHDILLIYWGWFCLFVFGVGLALVLSALALEFEVLQRLIPVMIYAILPFSGVFIMAEWVPESYRDIYLAIPMPHTIEMVRAGVLGEFVATHYDPLYPFFWGGVLIAFGLVLLARAKSHIDAE
ncbi:ABC transporter permease [Brevundimonas balnearis]|uniref:ABC transporter permease n=1 Tax=Brevundimonas balnearis TaxID=1572858 RepID=A0ABV6QYZ2_9CAUL